MSTIRPIAMLEIVARASRRRRDVAMRAEHRCKLPGLRPRGDTGPQRASARSRAELRRQQVGEGRRENEPRRQFFLHACNVYLQTIYQLHGGVQRAVGEVAELRQHNPVGVPGAGGAFMFLHYRCEQAGGQLLRDELRTEFEFNIRLAGTDETVFFDC
jgi:hypothetical protein